MDVVEGCEFSPISGVEVISFNGTEEETAGVGVGDERPSTMEALITGALRVAAIVALDDVDFDWWQYNVPGKTRLPSVSVRAASSGESPIDDVVLARNLYSPIEHIGHAWAPHPGHGVAARGASALCAEDGVATPKKRVRSVHAVPRVSFRDVNAATVAVVHERGHDTGC